MEWKSGLFRCASLLVAIGVTGSAQAQTRYYSIVGGGGQAQTGDGLPLPAQDPISSMGGKSGLGGPIGTYQNLPPLLIPVAVIGRQHPAGMTMTLVPGPAVVQQTAGADPKKMVVPPGVLRRVPTGPATLGIAVNNPRVLQVKTTLSFSAPAKTHGTMTFMAGQRVAKTATYNGTPAGSKVIYVSPLDVRFGGPSQTRVENLGIPGPKGAGMGIAIWALHQDIMGTMFPCKHPKLGGTRADCVAEKLPVHPQTLAAVGGPAGNLVKTPGTPPVKPASVALYFNGKIVSSTTLVPTGAINPATSVGFPWTTGAITISQPGAFPGAEKFHITGMDSRVNGVGTIQLVASSLSKRLVSGPNANRAWAEYQLPEPGAALGAAGALAVLVVCHVLVGRRR
jgi:hypothetical protein